MLIRGINLRQLNSIGIKTQLGKYEQFSYCNFSTATGNDNEVDDLVECYELTFPVKGVYSTFVVPDMHRQQQIKGLAKIHVEQFKQAQYSFTLPLPIAPPTQPPPTKDIPPSIMSIDEKLISVKSYITIRGIAFKEEEPYQCAFLPEVDRPQLQYTSAQFVDKETLQWNFKYIHTTGLIGCG